jgi:hypothetical protein
MVYWKSENSKLELKIEPSSLTSDPLEPALAIALTKKSSACTLFPNILNFLWVDYPTLPDDLQKIIALSPM